MANPVCEVLLTENELEMPVDRPGMAAGAIVDFHGVVRALEGDREIDGIDYEAHRLMAQHQLSTIANEAAGKFGLERVIVHHRLGFVPAGKASLWLRVAARHRAAAFRANEWIVDQLKQRVPIWKHPNFKRQEASAERPDEMETIQSGK
jgi:molybdopterin synthase catalytic subunit